jgi:hypothetical protein
MTHLLLEAISVNLRRLLPNGSLSGGQSLVVNRLLVVWELLLLPRALTLDSMAFALPCWWR